MKPSSAQPKMGMFWFFFFLLLFLHQDFWNWSTEEVSFLGMPRGLFYHAIFSVACSLLGAWAVIRAWPAKWEKYADIKDDNKPVAKQHSVQ
jgi:uncharacterized membrane protein YozB (DUF420 family)